MNDYYFTFGMGHKNKNGESMSNYWVRVRGKSSYEARKVFIAQFTSKYMDKPSSFAMQYDEAEFEPEWFPGGEYLFIEPQKNPFK